MDQIDLISDTEAESILDRLHKKRALVVPTMKTLTADLGEFQVSYRLDEGYIQKLIKTVSIVTGDIVSKRVKENPREFGIYPTKKIYNRIVLKEERRQRNIDGIVAKVIEFAREKEGSENAVGPDWIIEFFNIAQDCSHENMQYLWAKLLASEVEEPSSISRRTLSIIKLLIHQEARVFTKLCNCTWTFKGIGEFKEKVLIKDMYSNREQDEKAWNFDSFFIPHLSAIGLVEETCN
ncbi:MAG: DUF2806 domain-containing protein [Flavobacteriaceae bacterium]|nr:MAG: DUF2806 domain-containing protein [Flavobacteriaceae bacterium]